MFTILLLVTSCGKDDNPTNPKEEEKENATGTFTDSRDNKTYKWVEIGDQIWMAENLAYKPSSGKYWAYANDESNVAIYGYLYDWETAQNVAPTGWHLPTDAEWKKLLDTIGKKAANAMKETGTEYWSSPNAGSTNSSKFNARAGGYLFYSDIKFYYLKERTYWWSSTEKDNRYAWRVAVFYNSEYEEHYYSNKGDGFSVRCIKD